jgi:antitoxin ParD1/3/4
LRTTKQFSVTLPNAMAAMVRDKVECGEYASESEVVRDGLRALAARDKAMERWLKKEAGPALDAVRADPTRGRTLPQVRATLAALHKRTKKTR